MHEFVEYAQVFNGCFTAAALFAALLMMGNA